MTEEKEEAFADFAGVSEVTIVGGGPSGVYCGWRLEEYWNNNPSARPSQTGEALPDSKDVPLRLNVADKKLRTPKDIHLFEYSDRIGGRLLSTTLPGAPHVHVELGGMRYQPNGHPLVTGVIEKLNLPNKVFPMGRYDDETKSFDASQNLLYLRGKHHRQGDIGKPGTDLPYNLPPAMKGMSADQLQVYAMNHIIPHATFSAASFPQGGYGNQNGVPTQAADTPTPDLLSDDFTIYDSVPFKDIGYWNLLYKILGNEGYNLLRDAGGYDSNVVPNGNPAGLLPVADYGSDTEFRTLTEGYDKLPIAIHKKFDPDETKTTRNRRLKSIKSFPPKSTLRFPVWTWNEGSGKWELRHYRYRLIFVETKSCNRQHSTTDNYCPVKKAVKKYVWYTNKLILAMPRKSIELISWVRWQEIHESLIKSVVIQPSNKLLLAYSQPWWRNQGILAGRSITDLPLRMTYYFGTEGEQEGADPKNLNSAVVASYSDMINVQFWKGLERGTPYIPKENKYWNEEARQEWIGKNDEAPILAATQQMVHLAHSMLEEMHGFYPGSLPLPYVAMYKDWSGHPYGGGYHSWKAGFNYFDVIRKIRHPFPGSPDQDGEEVFITGSAYSNNQAWVEGAFEVAERVLQENFGLPQPDFVKPALTEAEKVALYGP